MISNNMKGFFYGIASSMTFGLIPLFTLPLMAEGLGFDSILFYRFFFASIALGILLITRKQSFRIERAELPILAMLGAFYSSSALFLFWGFQLLSSGIATTLHFLYPVFVTLVMVTIYKEKKSIWTASSILCAILGVGLLSIGDGSIEVNLFGVGIVAFSALSYALYIVGVNKSRIREMKGFKLTFYALGIAACIFFAMAHIKGTFQPIPSTPAFLNLIALAIIPTVLSNLALVESVKCIGSTLTAVLGASEPVTAICVGILIFNEPFTLQLAIGILLIIFAVSIIILSKRLSRWMAQFKQGVLQRSARA